MHKRKILCCLAMGFCLSLIWTTDTYAQKVSAGFSHALLIKKDGSLWAWGSNANGQVGTDSKDDESTPRRIGSDNNWFEIEAGESHSLAIKTNGTMWAWGKNEFGRLGDGTTDDKLTPTQIGTDTNWKTISAGKEHSLAIKTDGTLWAWGRNEFGQLGDGTTEDRTVPVQVGTDTDWAEVSAGYYHSAALKSDRTLWVWGDNRYNYLGDEATVNCTTQSLASPSGDYVINFFDSYGDGWNNAAITVIIDGDETDYTLEAGSSGSETISVPNGAATLSFAFVSGEWDSEVTFTIADPSGKTIISEGPNPLAGPITLYLCDEGKVDKKTTPVRLNQDIDWSVVSAGNSNTLATKSDGTLWAWGANPYGQLGNGTTDDIIIPTKVGSSTDWRDASAGGLHSLAIKTDGSLWGCGYNVDGALGDGTVQDKPVFSQVTEAGPWMGASSGWTYTIAVQTNGTLWTWGSNNYNVLGNGENWKANIPMQIGPSEDWRSIIASNTHSVGLLEDGSLWAWGSNFRGKLGHGDSQNKSIPVQVGSATDWEVVSTTRDHNLAIKTDGTLWGWGSNAFGELTNAHNTSEPNPVQIGSDTDWKLALAAMSNSYAIKLDGTLWAWGHNGSGQLGDATNISQPAPKQVGTDTNWKLVGAGSAFVVALKDDGTLWAWGGNSYGQVGNGSTQNQNTPMQIGTDTDWDFVAATTYRSFAIKTDGTLWGWGENGNGYLGDGSNTNILSPVQIGTDDNWLNVSPQWSQTLAMKSDGSLWAWGDNSFGQLGIGMYESRTAPVRVGTDVDWIQVSAGGVHSVALKDNGTLWTWGYNSQGRLGDGNAWKESPQLAKTTMDILLSNSELSTGEVATEVGAFSIINGSDGYAPSLGMVSGAGDTDNASFTIQGGALVTAATLDLQAKAVYSVRIQASDEFGNTFAKAFTINRVNSAPTALALDGAEIAENMPENTKIGLLSSTDSDEGDTFTYSLVAGEGSEDNASFVIEGNELQTALALDFEAKASLNVRIQTKDAVGAVFSAAFVITITDANDAPTAISLSASEFTENLPIGSELASLTATDQDENDSHTYTLVTGEGDTDNASFTISGNKLLANTIFDFETKAAYTIRIQTEDSGGEVFSQAFALTIINANDLPSDILLSSSVITQQIVGGIEVGVLSTTDQDASDTHTYELVAGDGSTDNTLFSITDNKLLTNDAIVNNKKEAYSVRIQSMDASEGVFSKAFSISTANLKAEQVITFELPANLYPDESPVALSASSTSELPVSFVLVSGPATLDGNQLTLTGSGEVVVMATQAGNDDFLPAANVTRTLVVKSFLSLAVTVNTSEAVVLGAGTATLLSSEGSIIKEATVGDGSLQMDGLKAGNYILQIKPGEEESELVNTTYYPSAVSFEEAELISIVENTALSMTMVAKEEVVQGLEKPSGSLQLYPNPASDQLVVSLSFDELKALESIRLYSMDGQFLRNLSVEKGQASLYLDVKTLEPGVYFLRLTFQDGISTGKFLKE
ncbi:MAG: T9SS type A sorting domain-containing protein [Imperialibacter sp.]|uniref:RCC1 domain-containing protein n=1 Tax=Imperialibacter sp. TaxID=2038411 RepID=UPI003A85CD21